jgi:resuscitation-promoting factor RpfA
VRALLPIVVLAFFLTIAPKARASPDYGTLARGFLCIHKGEGAWNANTGNGYYGGLQMDYTFMATYGREYLRAWGPAHNWPPSIQIAVAIRAYLSGRGFYPWPNTARRCGLI